MESSAGLNHDVSQRKYSRKGRTHLDSYCDLYASKAAGDARTRETKSAFAALAGAGDFAAVKRAFLQNMVSIIWKDVSANYNIQLGNFQCFPANF
jgi:hypothetical protein